MRTYLTPVEVKSEELEMLDELASFCDSEGLRYSLAGGTLLGAVRHGGFIPWDDDIDVVMPRPDYERLISLGFDGGLPQGLSIVPYSGSWEHPVFIKLINESIAVDTSYENGIGRLWVDVLPVDGLPDDKTQLDALYGKAAKLQSLVMLCKTDPDSGRTVFRRLVKGLFVLLANHTGLFLRLANCLDDLGKQRVFGSTPLTGCVAWGLYGTGECYPFSGWDKMDSMKFEGRDFRVIGCWNEYLEGIYGDYMRLPPKEKRVAHGIKAWRISK